MNSDMIDARNLLIERLTDMAGDLLSHITIDAAKARPLPGKPALLVNPPEIAFISYTITEYTWTLHLIAGTPATQAESYDQFAPVFDRFQAGGLNLKTARPATWQLAGAGAVACYEITLNPLD